MKYILTFVILLFFGSAFCQSEKQYTEISYINLKDSILINTIKRVISDQVASTDTSNLFKKGLGYIEVTVTKYTHKDTLRSYGIIPSGYGIKKESSEMVYPDYYSFIDNKLILINLGITSDISLKQFSESSKEHIRNLVDNCLEKPRSVTFYDENGKIAFTDPKFRIDYISFSYYNLYILKDKPPIVKMGEDYKN